MRCHALNENYKGVITDEECVEKIRDALECTLPYEIAIKPGEKYFTNEELACIQNMASYGKGEKEENARRLDMLEKQYEVIEREKLISCFINMYEVVMGCVASERGNMGDYDRSDEISKMLITESLYQRRTYGIHGGIYGMMWNDEQRRKKGIPLKRRYQPEVDLQQCIVFSRLGLEIHDEQFYIKKLSIQTLE